MKIVGGQTGFGKWGIGTKCPPCGTSDRFQKARVIAAAVRVGADGLRQHQFDCVHACADARGLARRDSRSKTL